MKYTPEVVEQICELIASGDYSNRDVCRIVNITEETFYTWKAEKSEFSESLKKADERRLEAFKAMARSGLAKKLDVFEYEEVKVEIVNMPHKKKVKLPDGSVEETTEYKPIKGSEVRTTKKVMPDTTAIMYVLNNQDGENFRHASSVKVDHTTGGKPISGGMDVTKLSKEELLQLKAMYDKCQQ